MPIHGGVLSALGMLVACKGRQLSRTVNGPLDTFSDSDIEIVVEQMLVQGKGELAEVVKEILCREP